MIKGIKKELSGIKQSAIVKSKIRMQKHNLFQRVEIRRKTLQSKRFAEYCRLRHVGEDKKANFLIIELSDYCRSEFEKAYERELKFHEGGFQS